MVANPDIESFIKEFTEKGLKENPLDVLVKIFVNDQDLQLIRRDFKRNILEKLVKKWKTLTDNVENSSERATEIYEKLNTLIQKVQTKDKEVTDIQAKSSKESPRLVEQPKQPVKDTNVQTDFNFLTDYQNIFSDIFSKIKEAYQKKNTEETTDVETLNNKNILKNQKFDLSDTLKSFIFDIKNIFNLNNENNNNLIGNLVNVLDLQKNNTLEFIKANNENPTNNTQTTSEEQKLFENKPTETIITFSTQTSDFLSKLVDKILKEKSEETSNVTIQQGGGLFGGLFGGLLNGLGGVAGLIGGAMAAIGGIGAITSFYWPEIKNYISEKFGDKAAETFDKFQGVVNAMSKFFTMGGLQMTFGNAFKTVGTFFGSISEKLATYATQMFSGVFDNIIGESAEVGGKVAGSTVGRNLKGLLARGAGLLLKGVSLTALKAIPLIGTVISFGQAWARFREGEYMQGLIDIAAGVTGLVPGVGTALSIGLSLLNTFIDLKGGEEKEQKAETGLSITAMLMKAVGWVAKIGSKLKFIPVIGSLLSFGLAWGRFQQNDILGGVLDIVSGIAAFVPGVGTTLAIGIDILNSVLDYQQGSDTSTGKASIMGNWFGSFYKYLRESYLVGTLIKAGEGLYSLFTGNIREGLELINELPFFGSVAGTFLSILDAFETTTDSKTGVTTTKFSFTKLADNLKKNLYKNLVNFFPEGFGIKSWFASMFGYTYDEKTKELVENNAPISEIKQPKMSGVEKNVIRNLPTEYNEKDETELKDNAKGLISNRKELEASIEEEKNKNFISRDDRKIEMLERQRENILESQKALNYKLKRYEELKEGKQVTTAEDLGVLPETELDKQISLIEEKIEKISQSRDRTKGQKLNLLRQELQELMDKKNKEVIEPEKANFYTDDKKLSNMLLEDTAFEGPSKSSFIEKRFDSKDGKIILDRSGNAIQLSSDDTIFASKKGDAVDKTFINLTNSVENLSKKMERLLMSKEIDMLNQRRNPEIDNTPTEPIIINNNNGSMENASEKVKISGGRDEIYLSRTEFLRSNTYGRF
jgi:hypothetical protein